MGKERKGGRGGGRMRGREREGRKGWERRGEEREGGEKRVVAIF